MLPNHAGQAEKERRSIIKGMDEVYASNQHGAPKSHLKGLAVIAKELGYPILIRPISLFARYYLQQGNPTKPFSVKNKSAKSGPMAGLIAIDAKHGRGLDMESIRKYQKYLVHAYEEDPALKPIPLLLKEERLKELCQLKAMEMSEGVTSNEYHLRWKNAEGGQVLGIARLKSGAELYDILDASGQPIEVLGRELNDGAIEAITADYDLFYIAIPYAEFDPGFLDKSPYRLDSHLTQQKKHSFATTAHFSFQQKQNLEKIPALETTPIQSREDKKQGNITERLRGIIPYLNDAVAAFDTQRQSTECHLLNLTYLHNAYPLTLKKIQDQQLQLSPPTLIKCLGEDKKAHYYMYAKVSFTTHPSLHALNSELVEAELNHHELFFQTKRAISISKNTQTFLYQTMGALPVLPGREIVHHSQEMHNPFADSLENNLPLLAIIPPTKKQKAEVMLILTIQAAQKLRDELIGDGFYFLTREDYKKYFSPFNLDISEEEFEGFVKTMKLTEEEQKLFNIKLIKQASIYHR